MSTAAIIANIGLLVTLAVYLLTLGEIEVEGREIPLFAFMTVSPIMSIIALVRGRGKKPVS